MKSAVLSIFKKTKPRVFLGELAVVPRTDIKRHLEGLDWFGSVDIDMALRNSLTEAFSLPSIDNIDSPLTTDLVIDVFIIKFQSGGIWDISLGEISFPLFWRPKITLTSRLYYLKTSKIKATFKITEKMNVRDYICRAFSFRPMLDQKDIESLLYQACCKLLLEIQKSI
ncbi:hypothetical protein [Methyloglobulus morosus]|uniref:hypothetical protein n=1 Tax=Methyloglobulus morosus TaxID=1410681 RepID=UPI00128F3793|nr:hypothetical protein [Methyloglobulus morosus]